MSNAIYTMSAELKPSDIHLRMIKARATSDDVMHVDFAAAEARIVAHARLLSAVDEIRRRAGVKRATVTVYFAHLTTQPPRLQWVGENGVPVPGSSSKRRTRRIIVGADWLQRREPKLWAVFVAARLIGLPTLSLAPTWGDNHKRI